MVVGRPRVRCLPARLTTRAVPPPTLPPMFLLVRSRPMQSQQTNAAPPCQMSQPPRKPDYRNLSPDPVLRYLLQRAHRGRFWTNSATHWTKPWMTKKFAVGFPTWVVTFLKKQDEDNKRSRRYSETKSLDGRLLSRQQILVGKCNRPILGVGRSVRWNWCP